MYSTISCRMNQLHNVTNVSCSHLSLFHVRKPPIYVPCATNVSSKFSTRLGSHFLRSTHSLCLETFLFFQVFLSAKNNKFFYACFCCWLHRVQEFQATSHMCIAELFGFLASRYNPSGIFDSNIT